MFTPSLILALTSLVAGHTWIEQFSLISANGTYTSTYGYPRNYVSRTDPAFTSLDYLIPQLSTGRSRINASDLLCHPSQRNATQSRAYPRLRVAPGRGVAIKYLENGHVTLPQNQPGKPPSGGPAFVFGTLFPKPDEKLGDVLAWTADGKGGDGRGVLLGAGNFDDGRCHQLNDGAISQARQKQFPDRVPGQPDSSVEQWCETDVVLPGASSALMKPGATLTVYWVWAWTTAPGVDPGLPAGKDEYYSTCSDFDVVADVPDAPVEGQLGQQDPQTAAVPDWRSRSAITSAPAPLTVIFSSGSSATSMTTSTAAATTTLGSTPAATTSRAAAISSARAPVSAALTLSIPPFRDPNLDSTTITTSSSVISTLTPTMTSDGGRGGATALPTDIDDARDSSSTTLTILVTVTAVLPVTQSMLVLQGTHVITFSQLVVTDLPATTATATATGAAAAAAADAAGAPSVNATLLTTVTARKRGLGFVA